MPRTANVRRGAPKQVMEKTVTAASDRTVVTFHITPARRQAECSATVLHRRPPGPAKSSEPLRAHLRALVAAGGLVSLGVKSCRLKCAAERWEIPETRILP